MSLFDIFNNGTATIVKCNATQDTAGGPVAGYFDEDGDIIEANVIDADVPCQINYHRTKLLGNEAVTFGQNIVRSERDIRLTGTFEYLGETGEGYGVQFTWVGVGTGFGRITDLKRDLMLLTLPTRTMLVVEVIA